MAVLNPDDRLFLDRCFERMLELHAGGAVSAASAIEYLGQVVDAVDRQSVEAVRHPRLILEEAWRDADA